MRVKFTLLGLLILLGISTSFAQQNPAVTAFVISPDPITGGVGSAFTISITLGNTGPSPITGTNAANVMGFGMTLGKSSLATGNVATDITGGEAYFDITWDASTNTFTGAQKVGTSIPGNTTVTLVISATVSQLTSSSATPDIGGRINIYPSASSQGPYDPSDGSGGNNQNDDTMNGYTRTTTTLPVSLVSFTVQAQEDRTVLLNWSTSWERANKGYIIERSKDLKIFEKVDEVSDVAGTSNSLNKYSFVDLSPYRGTSYYRLRQVDLDGTINTFDAKPVVIDGRYGVYPNPIIGQNFTLELDEPATATLRLFSATGNELSIGKSEITEMSTKVAPNAKLPAGIYVLTVEERGTTRKHRLVVQ